MNKETKHALNREVLAALKNLRCPYCGSEFEAELVYAGHAYSEHRDLDGYSCENNACGATWDSRGDALEGPFCDTQTALSEP